MVLERAGVEAGGLAAGEGVEMPADRLEGERDLVGIPPLRALEDHVLEEVRSRLAPSWRAPTLIQTPMASERTESISSPITVSPDGRTVR